ncbi:MAG: hypothetical protein IKR86_08580, partial [Candidatus Methanomethylophilaceae archaeon]|nr:hypothetical protein [Candidatus Methanomethylophilaceae archaeon]
ERVELVKRYSHAPDQANINLGKFGSDGEMMDALRRLVDTGTVRGISVSVGAGTTDEDCVRAIALMRGECPGIPIGLSYRVCQADVLSRIKGAGATEFKLNVGSTSKRVFDLLNPGQDLNAYMECYRDAVRVFGKGSVANSFFVGLGETCGEVEKSFRDVASCGVLSDIKIKRLSPVDRARFESVMGAAPALSPEKLSDYGRMLKRIEEENGLDARTYKTLCNACRGCNLVPFLDF